METKTVRVPGDSFKNSAASLKCLEGMEISVEGNTILFGNKFFLFGDDRERAPTETLLVVNAIRGNYGEVLSANAGAKAIADLIKKFLDGKLETQP